MEIDGLHTKRYLNESEMIVSSMNPWEFYDVGVLINKWLKIKQKRKLSKQFLNNVQTDLLFSFSPFYLEIVILYPHQIRHQYHFLNTLSV